MRMVLIVLLLTWIVALLLTGVQRRIALRTGLIDLPNARSSHTVPTPRGGGVAILIASTAALALLGTVGYVSEPLVVALVGGGLPVALIGYLDDRRGVHPVIRLCVQGGAAAWAMAWLGPVKEIDFFGSVFSLGVSGYVLGELAVVWAINLFNFMDGIDGIAASEAAFVSLSISILGYSGGEFGGLGFAAAAFGGACLGFLPWNWSPAKIFMGDVGSGFLGYFIAVLALSDTRTDPHRWSIWLILAGVFFVDATATLIRRISRGERAHVAHRSHAYQKLALRWQSHWQVTLLVAVVNVFWLFPCALCAILYPGLSSLIGAIALIPLVFGALCLGAGHSDRTP